MHYLDTQRVAAFGYTNAADAILAALDQGIDPATDPQRLTTPLAHGSFLLMPSQGASHAGIKIITHAPGNAERAVPTIQGLYLLCDGTTLTPQALLDGEALTTLRTPALSVAASRPFLHRQFARAHARGEQLRVVIFGAGPQGVGHVHALREEADALAARGDAAALAPITLLVRTPDNASPEAHAAGTVLAAGSAAAVEALTEADVVVCATGTSTPLFAAEDVRGDALVIALGSHTPEAREVPAELMGRATVIVEDEGAAMREAGDVIQAVDEGVLRPEDLISLGALHAPGAAEAILNAAGEGPVVVKTVGMGWQDLAVATAIAQQA
ncbi:ornithine cyclodeaminase family protein [Corynebacterium sp. zg-331]|uniref:ornithine cyclodeaminase family protein n=1 Tax=unclassified Corynebacterium TaxID=2624378 RepID=UPI00128B9E32|nr:MULTISPECIES: ornithine cyclodeaminase family protein [unclassified Corynebacterium]MBC3185651.1 ornithine cyclodeaminase family protein [Corynebacterium sp. zg-331]MPV52145.1 ornithine cyclodeaminase family protein [Corynebacterium sp. zg331]